MQRRSVTSSNIASVGWQNGTLEIEFNNGGVYQYEDVPQDVYLALVNASSPGRYFQANVRSSYPCHKVE